MHLFEKNGAPWSEKIHKIGLLLFVIMISYGVAIAEYKNASAGSTIALEQAFVGGDARIDTESVSDNIAPSTADEVEDGVSAKPQVNREDVVAMIAAAFPENQGEALKIAKCESTLDPTKIGDHHLTFWYNGQEYGKSYGLFMVRSGGVEKNGKIWTRTDNVEQFERDMKDPKKNLEAAKKIYRGDWSPWYNCAVKEGLM